MARLDGSSLFMGVTSGLNNTYSVLSNTFKDGITLANLNSTEASTALSSNSLGTNFKSYLTTNFSQLDKDGDGKIGVQELQSFTNSLSTTGMTKEQLCTLGTSTGMSSSLLNTVTQYFEEIDTNKDGKVTQAEIQDFNNRSEKEKQRKEELERMLSNMSTFYETTSSNTGSLLDYKYLQDDENS